MENDPATRRPSGTERRLRARGARRVAWARDRRVLSVLSDGPDPGADSVGYAEAQIRQLRLLHTSPQPVGRTIGQLASAYQAYSSSDGTNAAAKHAAVHAIRAMNAICPGPGATI
jgi:hypothetical protein